MKHRQESSYARYKDFIKISDNSYGHIWHNGDFMAHLHYSTFFILNYQQVMMIADTISSRYLSLLTLDIYNKTSLDHMPPVAFLQRIYSWGDQVLKELGNDGYSVIKCYESICTGYIITKYDPLQSSPPYLEEIILSAENPSKVSYLRELKEIIIDNSEHPNHIIEIFGCYRHFGHPVVDELAGVEDLRSNTRKKIDLNQQIMRQVSGAFNRMFILNFIQKNQRWPNCHLSKALTDNNMGYNSIKQLLSDKPLVINLYDQRIKIEDWSYIDFDKELEFDNFLDFTELLSDTAISPYKKNFYSVYQRDMTIIEPPKNMKESRRTLLEILSRPSFDISEIRRIIENNEVPESWFVVGLHSKEREIKIKSRLFAMMVLEMRMYFACTEKNLANGIMKYMPTQTMTWSEAELTKYLMNMTDEEGDKDYIPVAFSLGYTKFNQRWRFESTELIFKTIDQLYGTKNLYLFSHKFFENSLFYLSSGLSPPSIIARPNDLGRSIRGPQTGYIKPEGKILIHKLLTEDTERTWIGQPG